MPLYRLGFLLIGPVFASAQVLPAADPVPGANIAVLRWTYSNGTRQLRPANNFANSQADGSFVIGNLAPGRYILGASFGSRNLDLTEISNGPLASRTSPLIIRTCSTLFRRHLWT